MLPFCNIKNHKKMNTTQQNQKLAILLCDSHSHGTIEQMLKESWTDRNVPVLTNWEALAPYTHCLVVAVMSAMSPDDRQSLLANTRTLCATGCSVGMVLVEPFAFEVADAKVVSDFRKQLETCGLAFLDARSMESSAIGSETKGLNDFLNTVYADVVTATRYAVADNWGEKM